MRWQTLIAKCGPRARALGRMGARAEMCVPTLVRLLGDFEERPKKEAAKALGLIGPVASKAVPFLRLLSKNSGVTPVTRATAAASLWKISGDTNETIPILVNCLNSRTLHGLSGGPPQVAPDDAARYEASKVRIEIACSDTASKELVRRSMCEGMTHSDDVRAI